MNASCEKCGTENGLGQMCIKGVVYGFCGDERCGGVCEANGRCICQCHNENEAEVHGG